MKPIRGLLQGFPRRDRGGGRVLSLLVTMAERAMELHHMEKAGR